MVVLLATADWATIATAGFTAVAAGAAWATVASESRRERRHRLPWLVVVALRTPATHFDGLSVTNAGGGPAIAPVFFGVDAGVSYGGTVGPGVLQPGENKLTHATPVSGFRDDLARCVVMCRARDGRVHWWTTDDRYGSARVGRFRRFRKWPTIGQVFAHAYPTVRVPDD